jgi:hypothetical protein
MISAGIDRTSSVMMEQLSPELADLISKLERQTTETLLPVVLVFDLPVTNEDQEHIKTWLKSCRIEYQIAEDMNSFWEREEKAPAP